MMKSYETIDEYIANFPLEMQEKLQQVRRTITEAAPNAKEKISYGIPTFTLHGNLVHFGGYDTHIGFYPGPASVADFKDKLSGYETAKGTIKFPLDKSLPLDLIRDITLVCVQRNTGKKS